MYTVEELHPVEWKCRAGDIKSIWTSALTEWRRQMEL